MRLLRLVQLPVEQVHRLLDLPHLLHQPVVDGIAAQLDVRPVGAGLKAALGHLK